MSSTILSQIETNETKSNLRETLTELAAVATMFAVTATVILLASLSWVA
ncbi:hypothetical protein L3Q72_18065 [Vibrio sp. JC009]|nr:hypothetical protein [Vibrio sp. JC009]WED24782.1 hypothetical protein L3Q72_18065 [Vibrio sp. JC009]